ncbi:hypothetical protein CBR_g48662 [Chara braunii]|uniref:Tr-type G domain-containing protein n=1 Tax=Chara braunii TaxID=69332 RepID=A0A388K4D0_CHABU|nr:hypothetical protein CBR_g48662 [Chara braunii]|eukprot:GBG64914.1 hypothetical protein CBR_g48662 [Chara braunii]
MMMTWGRRSLSRSVRTTATCLRCRAVFFWAASATKGGGGESAVAAIATSSSPSLSAFPLSSSPLSDPDSSAAATTATCRDQKDFDLVPPQQNPIWNCVKRSSIGGGQSSSSSTFPPLKGGSSSATSSFNVASGSGSQQSSIGRQPSSSSTGTSTFNVQSRSGWSTWQRWRSPPPPASYPTPKLGQRRGSTAVVVLLSPPPLGFSSPSSSSSSSSSCFFSSFPKMAMASAMAGAPSSSWPALFGTRNLVTGSTAGMEREERREAEEVEQNGGKSAPRDSSSSVGIRDLAIIAHVDHGKTTLMDRLLKHCGLNLEGERVMDSITLEKERGITIASKCTSFEYKGYVLNVVDTPGHADFGGEVERVLDMVDGVVLLVDATEGPLAQTKFVLGKALRKNLRPLVVLNKADRPTVTRERCTAVENEIFDLFASLDATDEQLDFPLLYASARDGWASKELLPRGGGGGASSSSSASSSLDNKNKSGESGSPVDGMDALLDAVVEHVPEPTGDPDAPFRFLVSMIDRDPYVGRILTGRISDGTVRVGDRVVVLRQRRAADGGGGGVEQEEEGGGENLAGNGGGGGGGGGQVTKIFKTHGTTRTVVQTASAGDIVSIAGIADAGVTDTIASPLASSPLPATPIDPPTIMMSFAVNDSPLAGKDGSLLTGSKIGERLRAEAETNVSITVEPTRGNDAFHVCGRGELQLGVLIENMRREGFELSVSPPKVLYRKDEVTGATLEPIEEVMIEVDDEYVGAVIEGISLRRGDLTEMVPNALGTGKTRLSFTCPSRGLIGYRSVFNTETRGTGMIHRSFLGYEPKRGPLDRVRKGALVAMTSGAITAHALMSLEARGILFVEPQAECYDGMIIGEHSREGDLEVNPVRTKHLSNVRSAGNDENVRLSPPRQIFLEEAIGYVGPDELIEVTPKSIRLRKRYLNATDRKTLRRNKATND